MTKKFATTGIKNMYNTPNKTSKILFMQHSLN